MLLESLVVIFGYTVAELAARIAETWIQLRAAIVAEKAGQTIAHVHAGQRLAANARAAILARIRRAVVDGDVAE